jgi:hypothetical protein
MSKSLLRILDECVLPAALLISAKVLGIVMLNMILKLDWNVKSVANSFFSTRLEYSGSDAILVSSYSNIFMYITIFSGLILILAKLFYLHPKHATPQLVLKLAKADLLHWIKSAFDLYHQVFVWLVFLVITTVFIFMTFLNNETYEWVAWITVVITLVLLWIFVRLVDRDLASK